MAPNVGEPVVVYTGNENNPNIVTEGRDDIRHAIWVLILLLFLM